jgi:hypothetical protein
MIDLPSPYEVLFKYGQAGPDIPYPSEVSSDFEWTLTPVVGIFARAEPFTDNEWIYA